MAVSPKQEIESRGVTVDAAISAGLQRLGVDRDQVTVIVIDEGSRGLLGIGSREAIVRLAIIPEEPETPVIAPPPPPIKPTPPPLPPPAPARVPAPRPVVEKEPLKSSRPPVTSTSRDEAEDVDSVDYAAHLDAEREAAIDTITELLTRMHVSSAVTGFLTEPDDLTGQQVNVIEISGEDLGVLIGPRGETLDSLQFLSRLMVAHKLHRRANFVVDVEGFRQRREQALTRLAERMADKARQRGEAISLEPMSAYERRIVHMALRNAPDVFTESTGEGKQRRVRIIPKA